MCMVVKIFVLFYIIMLLFLNIINVIMNKFNFYIVRKLIYFILCILNVYIIFLYVMCNFIVM